MEQISKNHYFVNWIDGMKINKSHFQDSDKATIALVNNIAGITVNQNHYGFLALKNGYHQSESINLTLDGQDTLMVQLNECKAITSGGYYVDISEETNALLGLTGSFLKVAIERDKKSTSNSYYIVLNIDPFKAAPIGETHEDEDPPRHPYLLAEYSLHAISEDQINDSSIGGRFLIIGKMIYNENTPELVSDYIPPCYSIQSHQDLVYIYSEIGVFFNSIEKYCLQIIQKIFQKKQTNELAHMVLSISQNVWQYTSSIIPEYRLEDLNASPLKIITRLMTLARIVKNSIDVYTGTGKEELVNYLTDWSDKTQGDFEKRLADMIDIEYKHYDMNLSLVTVSRFSKITLSLFKKLDELDYIGKKSDSNIFVKEEVVVKQDVKERRSFLLD